MPDPRTKWGVGALVLVVVVGAAIWRINKGPSLAPGELAERPECGHDATEMTDTNFTQTSRIPEYNDCQKFVTGDAGARQYGARYAIFVSSVASSIRTMLGEPLPAVTRLPLTSTAGISTNLPTPPAPTGASATPAPMAQPNARAITVAIIDGGADYEALGIKQGRNCLYVWNYNESGSIQWKAKMAAPVDDQCPARTVGELEPLPGRTLQVYREEVVDPETNQKFTADDYPNVARWDWDAKSGKQYVSIVCEVAWCEIGEDGFERSPALPLDGADTAPERRVRLIKGWNDQQHLAMKVGDDLVPSPLMGTIFPVPDLDTKNDKADFAGWTTVAWIVAEIPDDVSDDVLEQYKQKLGFRKSSFGRPLRLQLQHRPSNDTWRARVGHRVLIIGWGNKENRVKFRNTGATGYPVPGTARWRWKDNDEGTWTRCTSGCCEMSD